MGEVIGKADEEIFSRRKLLMKFGNKASDHLKTPLKRTLTTVIVGGAIVEVLRGGRDIDRLVGNRLSVIFHNSGQTLERRKRSYEIGAGLELDIVDLKDDAYVAHSVNELLLLSEYERNNQRFVNVFEEGLDNGARLIKLDIRTKNPVVMRQINDELRSRNNKEELKDVKIRITSKEFSLIQKLERFSGNIASFTIDSHELLNEFLALVERWRENGVGFPLKNVGISIEHGFLTEIGSSGKQIGEERAKYFIDNGISIDAFVVNRMRTVNKLGAMGVDVVTTDERKIMQASRDKKLMGAVQKDVFSRSHT